MMLSVVTLALSCLAWYCTASVVPFAVFDWASAWNATTNSFGAFYSPGDGGYTQLIEAQFSLAKAIFNERNAKILPVLGNLTGCNKNLSMPYFCNTAGNPRIAFADELELAQTSNPPLTILGPTRTASAEAMAMAATVLGDIPIISHWATSVDLADKSLFPTFMRTIPSDGATVVILGKFLQLLNINYAYLIFENSDFGSGWKDSLFSVFSARNAQLKFSAFDIGNPLSFLQAFAGAQQSSFNVIIIVAADEQMPDLAAGYAASYANVEQKPLMIFPTLDSIKDFVERAAADSTIAALGHSSIALAPIVPPNANWDNYLQLWQQGYFSRYESEVNQDFPPNGKANTDQGCANVNYTYALPVDGLGPSYVIQANDVWTYAFDAVIALGIATCQLFPTDSIPSTFTDDILPILLNLRFEGLSGDVYFIPSTGDRDPTSVGFTLTNFARPNDTSNVLNVMTIGGWNTTTQVFDLVSENSVVLPNGQKLTLINDVVVPQQNMNYLPQGLKILGYVEVAFLNVAGFSALIWLMVNRRQKVIVNAQGTFLMLLVFGCIVASWAILPLTVDDQTDEVLNPNIACNAAFILFSLGFQLAMIALIVKIYRIYFVFKASKKLRRRGYRTGPLLAGVGVLMLTELVAMIIWVIVAPLQWSRLVSQVDSFGNPLSSYGECTGSTVSVAFVAVVFTIHAISLALTSNASNHVRDLPVQYQESKWINLSVMSMLQIYLVSIPAVIASYNDVTGRFVIMSSVVVVTVGALLLCLLFPKIFPAFFELSSSDTNEEIASDKRVSPFNAGVKHASSTRYNETVQNNNTNTI